MKGSVVLELVRFSEDVMGPLADSLGIPPELAGRRTMRLRPPAVVGSLRVGIALAGASATTARRIGSGGCGPRWNSSPGVAATTPEERSLTAATAGAATACAWNG